MKKITYSGLVLISYLGIFWFQISPLTMNAACSNGGQYDAFGNCPGDNGYNTDGTAGKPTSSSAGTSKTVIVTEKVPGANCVPYDTSTSNTQYDDGSNITTTRNQDGTKNTIVTDTDGNKKITSDPISTRKYKCTIEPGFGSFQTMFAQIIRWFVFIVMLLGVLGIVGLGIAWAWAGGDDVKAKGNLKKWGINIAIGLIILFFFRYILTIIAPWIYN